MDVRKTLNVIAICFVIYLNVIDIAECESLFLFDPESIYRGKLRNHHFKVESLLCADTNWNFESAKTVCRTFGFSDVMMYTSENNQQVEAVSECVFESGTNIKCENINSEDCNKLAWVACQLPGFEGCYSGRSPPGYTQFRITGSLTIEKCLSGCRTNGNAYASLSNGVNCYCSNQLPSNKRPSSNCNKPCQGDTKQACGGDSYNAVYNTLLGSCDGSRMSDIGFITSPGFPGDNTDNDCQWHFETSYFNRTSISIIGAKFQGGLTLGLNFETTEIHRRTYVERDVSFELETTGASTDSIWRTPLNPIIKDADVNMVRKNITVRYSKQSSNAKWFILKFEVEKVEFERMTSTMPTLTTSNRASGHFSLSYLYMMVLFTVVSYCTHHLSG